MLRACGLKVYVLYSCDLVLSHQNKKKRLWYFPYGSCHVVPDLYYCTSSAVANLAPTLVTLILLVWPTLPFFTKITNPCTLAMPSPCLLVSVICTSYSFPVSTGFGPKLPPKRPPPPKRLSPYDIS